jgi:hypothetical protein
VSDINIIDTNMASIKEEKNVNTLGRLLPSKIGLTSTNSTAVNFFPSNCGYSSENRIKIREREYLKGTKVLSSEGITQSGSPYLNPVLRQRVDQQSGVYAPERAR